MTLFKFGEDVKGYDFPVLNEREIRAAAGIFFVFILMSTQRVVYLWDFTMLKFISTFFWGDFVLRLFVSPRFSPSLILGRLIVRNQTPEYVGAEQKKFAWSIGLALGSVIMVSLNILNIHSPITGIICLLCLLFLFFESAFGICLGCKLYPWVFRKKPRLCPGEVCERRDRQMIQFTNKAQILVLALFFALFFVTIPLLKDSYIREPELALGMKKP